MRNPVIVAHKRIIRRQWVEALATQAAGHAAMAVAVASIFATGAYALSTTLDSEKRTRPPVVAMGLLMAVAGALGSKAAAAEAEADWAYYRSLRDETALIVANAARFEVEQNWGRNTALGAVAGGQAAQLSQGVSEAVSALPPSRDVAGEIAAADGHACIVAKTRSGKTTLMIDGIRRDVAMGRQVLLIDGKGDRRLQQLQGITYLQVNRPERVPKLMALLDGILQQLASRQDGATGAQIALWIDEHNLVRASAAQYAKLAKRAKDDEGAEVEADYLIGLERVLLQGAAAGIYARLSSHTSRVSDLGFNTGVLDSVSFIALGRKGANESIDDLLLYQFKGRTKKQLEAQAEQLTAQAHLLGETPLILTTHHPRGFCIPAAPTAEPHPVLVAMVPQQQPAQDIRQQLEGLLERSPAMPPDGLPVKREESKLSRLMDYLKRHAAQQPVKRRQILLNWAVNNGVSAQQLDQMLDALKTSQSVVVSPDGYQWGQ
jgi:hypothetical protein